MDETSVGMADSEPRSGSTPIFDELVGRFGLTQFAEPIVGTAGEHAERAEQVAVAS
jgi:hypothetical protein